MLDSGFEREIERSVRGRGSEGGRSRSVKFHESGNQQRPLAFSSLFSSSGIAFRRSDHDQQPPRPPFPCRSFLLLQERNRSSHRNLSNRTCKLLQVRELDGHHVNASHYCKCNFTEEFQKILESQLATASALACAAFPRSFQKNLLQVPLRSRSNSIESSLAKDNSTTDVKTGQGPKGSSLAWTLYYL